MAQSHKFPSKSIQHALPSILKPSIRIRKKSQKAPLSSTTIYLIASPLHLPHLHLWPPPAVHSCFYAPSHPASSNAHTTYTPHTHTPKQRSRRLLGLVIITFDLLFSSWCFTQRPVEWQWQFNAHAHTLSHHFSTPTLQSTCHGHGMCLEADVCLFWLIPLGTQIWDRLTT